MEDALANIHRHLPQVLLVDIGLPGMSGIEGITLLKERHPQLLHLMLTVYDDDDRIMKAFQRAAIINDSLIEVSNVGHTIYLDGKADEVRSALQNIPEDPDAEYLAGAGRVAILAREMPLAKALFLRAIERDPSSYRATLGIASIFLLERDFDSASRAFDAARSRTHDKDEQKFLSAALGDLATIKVR
jgi:CheY-like chemotaxis protein